MNETTSPPAAERFAPTPAPSRATRPFFWSVRRELWENRSIAGAPLAVAALALLGSLGAILAAPRDPAALARPFAWAPAPIMLTTFLVGFFYALDALYGERRDRSLLFWKSLPVSDRTTVLAKASVPLLVLPLIGLVLSMITLAALFLLGSLLLAMTSAGPAALWAAVPRLPTPIVMAYGLAVHTLWFAPIFGWLLLVSAWARRLPLAWAALPPLVLAALEKATTGGEEVGAFLARRVTGAMSVAFRHDPRQAAVLRSSELAPLEFLSTPGLWLGLVFAAACLAAAVRLRRVQEMG